MPIDIKEIFESDLDPNSSVWFSSKKVDKLNYNFNQLSEGGNPGPLGEKGADGNYGQKGEKGFLGNQGHQGFEGFKGELGDSTWIYVDGQNNRTVFPNQPPQNQSFSPQSVKIGFDSNSNDYTQVITSGQGAVLSLESDSFQGQPRNGISFYSEGNYIANLGVRLGSTFNDVLFKEEVPDGKREWYINQIDFKNPSANSVFVIQGDENNGPASVQGSLRFLASSEFNSTAVQHNDSVKLTSGGPDDTKVLVALDSTGLVQWQKKSTVFGSIPFGSIVALNKAEWNSTNFEQAGTIANNQTELNNIFGRGKGNFEGWYLCNGETWTNGSPAISYDVPNLSSFDYTIDANADNSQEIINNGGNNDPILVGGADVSMNSVYNSGYTDQYETQLTSDNSDDTITVNTPQYGTARIVSNEIWIVNLENPNLFWINNTATTGPSTEAIVVSTSSTQSGACNPGGDPNDEQGATYYLGGSWDPLTHDWTSTSQDMSGVYIYTDANATTVAPSKWYQFDNLSRFWSGSAFTQYFECPVTLSLSFDVDVRQLNGAASSLTNDLTVTIDTNTFATATQMTALTGNIVAGWYRETGSYSGARRYWSGSSQGSFIGHTFTEDYVYFAGQYFFNQTYGSSICNASIFVAEQFNTYITSATSNPFAGISTWTQPEDYYLYLITGLELYVSANFGNQSNGLGRGIIYKAKNGSSPVAGYNTLRGTNVGGEDYSTINSNSTTTYQGVCPVLDNKLYQQQSNGSYTQVGDIVETVDNINLTIHSVDGRISKNNNSGAGGGPGLKLTVEVAPLNSSGPTQQCLADNNGNPAAVINIDFQCYDGSGNVVFDHQQNYFNSGSNTQTFTAYIGDAEMNLEPLGDYDFTCIYSQSCMNAPGEITIELDPT